MISQTIDIISNTKNTYSLQQTRSANFMPVSAKHPSTRAPMMHIIMTHECRYKS